MASNRLSDEQKQDLAERYQRGEGSQALAAAFGCSANTVTRLVKAALGEEVYGQLKRQRGKANASAPAGAEPAAAGVAVAVAVEAAGVEEAEEAAGAEKAQEDDDEDTGPGVLAIDDADDFGEDDDSDDDEGTDGGDGFGRDREGNLFVAVPVGVALEDRPAAACQPLETAPLPECLYMLVDKTVELQARPLSDFPELGRLPDGEEQRQALLVFANPRQAKRHCGRTQRVIKLPDSQVLRRTAPYLLVQGITRLVLEGAVYSLPGS